jgi:type VI secretion system protein ImpF
MQETHENLRASILDKLIDNEPGDSSESVYSRMSNFRDIEASVIRDIENLLNTRRTIHMPPATLHEVAKSLYTYGLRDFTAENPSSSVVVQKLRREIAQTITFFEPRLKNVVVHIENRVNSKGVHFRIAGTLVIYPISEPVIFDTSLDPNRGEYLVSR